MLTWRVCRGSFCFCPDNRSALLRHELSVSACFGWSFNIRDASQFVFFNYSWHAMWASVE